MAMEYTVAQHYQHVYEGEEGMEFVASRPAMAICGYVASGKGLPAVGRCPDCTNVLTERRGPLELR